MEELETIVQRMIDAGESEDNIKLVIEEYTKDVEKTNGSQKEDATVEPNVMASKSEDTSLELQEDKGFFEGVAEKFRKYTPSFALNPIQKIQKQAEDIQRQADEYERTTADDYVKDKDDYVKFLQNEFLTDDKYNYAALDLRNEVKDVRKELLDDLGVGGFFGSDTRTQYMNLNDDDVRNIFNEQFDTRVLQEKAKLESQKIQEATQRIIDSGSSLDKEFSKQEDVDIMSFENPLERQLGKINQRLRVEGISEEEKNNLIKQQKEVVEKLKAPKKIINRQGQITEIASDNENFNFFYNPITGQGSNVETDDSQDLSKKVEAEITELSMTTQDKLEDYYNNNVLENVGHKSRGNKTYDITIGNKTFGRILRDAGYESDAGVVKNVPVSEMARFAHLFDDSPSMFIDKNNINISVNDPNKSDFETAQDFADYLRVHQEQGRDIAAKKHAIKQVYLLNKDVTSIKKKPVQRHFEAASEGIIGPRATESNFGYSNRKILDQIEEITADADITLNEKQKEYLERSIGDEINEGFGGAYGILGTLLVANKVQGTVLGVTRLGRLMSTLNAPRYVKNGRVVTQAQMTNRAVKSGQSFDDVIAGYTKVGPSRLNQFNGLLLTGTMEEIKMQSVGFDPGVGAGFMLGAKALPFKFNTKYTQLNTLLSLSTKQAPAFVLGTNFGEITKGAIDDIAGEDVYSAFLQEHYGDLDKLGRKAIVDLALGAAFGATHLKRMDLMRTDNIGKLKNDAMFKMIEAHTKGDEATLAKYQEVYSAAKNRLDAMDKIDLYTNPATAQKAYQKQLDPIVKAFKAKGKDLVIETTTEELVDKRNAEYIPMQGGNPGKIRININRANPGLMPHEVSHAAFDLLFEGNPTLKAKYLNQLKNITKELKLEDGRSLYEAILTEKSIKDVNKVEEMFSYTTEYLSRAEHYTSLVAGNAFGKLKQNILSFSERNGLGKPALKTQQDLVNFLGRYVETIQKGYNPIKQLERLNEIVEISEARKEGEKASLDLLAQKLNTKDKSKDLFLRDQQTYNESPKKGVEDMPLLYRADRFVRDNKGNLKYEDTKNEKGEVTQTAKEKFQRSEDFSNFFMELSKPEGIFDNVIKQEGRKAGVNEGEMSSYVERVKDNLIVSANRFNPAEAGGSIFGYFKNTAIPFEGLRIRTEFLDKLETGEKGKKVELDKEIGEGKTKIEIEAENSFRETSFENENIGIEAQLRYREYLKEAGLNEAEAEAYMPTGKGINVAKKLKIEAPEINIDNIDLTSYKNIRKTANEQTGDKVATEYFNIKPELWSIMKSTPAKNLNKPARKSIQEKIEADVQTIIKLLPQGAQNLISERGENITPEVLKNTSTGNKKVLLQIPMLYTKTSRTGKNLAEYVKTTELIKYEKLVDPKEGTPEFDFKQSFENRFLAEFGIGENAFKGRNLDQRLKAVVSETIGSIHNQSVRKVMNDLLMPKNLINQAAAGKSSALASKTLEKLAGQRGGADFITFLNEIKKESFSQLLGRNLRSPIDPEKGLAKALIEHFTNYKRSGLGEFNVSNADLRQIAKEIQAQYKFGQVTPAVVASKLVRAAESPNKLENIERQAGLEPSKFELNTPEDIVEARAVARVVTKALVEKYGDGVYEQVLMRGESGGKGIGAYPDFSSMMDGFGKSQNRFSSWESSAQAIEYYSDVKNSKGLKYTGPQKRLVEGQGNKKGQLTRLIDKKTGEWSTKALNEAYKVGEFNKDVLKTAVKTLREAYKAGDITYSQARAWVEIHGGPMSGLIKLSGSFSVVPNMSVKEMYKKYGKNPSDYVLEHTTPAQYVKAKIYDYILNGTKAKKDAMDLTLADYHTTLIPKSFDVMVNKTLQTDLPSWHRPGMDPIASRYYEANHPSDFGFGLKNFKTGKVYDHNPSLNSSQKQKIQKQIKEANIKAFPKGLRKYAKTQLASKNLKNSKILDKALELGRKKKKNARGMSTFDFDETLVIGGKNSVTATKGKESIKITSEEFPLKGPELAKQGYKFDFSDFVNVKGGKEGPLMQKLRNQIEKYGTDNVFVLTARMQEAAPAIHAWLKSKGVELKLENITGLGNSTGEAKAMWMLEKFSEGYNDMYFVDDALPNVKAVKDVLSQLDIKSKVQQALASVNLNKGVNDIMQHSLGIKSNKVFSKAEGKVRGKDIKRRRFFMPDTASDLELLLEPLYGKGQKGIENKKWFEENFIRKWERGINDFNNARQAVTNDYLALRKKNKDVVKQLPEVVEGTNFTHDMAMRVYIWNKNGYTIPDLTPSSQKKLVSYVINNPKLQAYAENVARLTKVEGGLKEPSAEWWGETIASEIQDLGKGIGRKKYIQDFIDSKNEIFSEANLNKMESKLGSNWRETIEDMFDRMETGRTRSMKLGKIGNQIMNYLNGSTGAIMNFNTRSATLQLISTVNFVNSSFNNPLRAGQAFANQPQYWKDFMFIMNSDMLKQRRQGLEINVSEAELASAASESKNPAKSALAKILKAGYLPTKIADSFAIAAGGATYYRNAVKKYTKEGLSKAEAEKKAFIDFQAIAERTQQSSRADLLSKQQTSLEGRLILPFANTPMQMNRIMIKDMLDLSKGRYEGFYGENSLTSKMSRIGYYGFVQSLIFAGLQSGAFALMTNSDDDKKIAESKLNMLNTVADSFLRGMGIQGAVVNGIRLSIQEFIKQDGKTHNADYSEVAEKLLNISPTVGSKFSKLDAAGNTYKYNKKVIQEEGLTLNGPLLEASTQVIEATTNAPLNRYYKKGNNIQNALDDSYYNWQRVLMGAGWSSWGLGSGKDKERTIIVNKGKENEYTRYLTKEQLRREKVEETVKQKEKKAKKAKQQQCTKIKSDGRRCKVMVNKPKTRCHYHD